MMTEEAKDKLFDMLASRGFFLSEIEEILECVNIVDDYYNTEEDSDV